MRGCQNVYKCRVLADNTFTEFYPWKQGRGYFNIEVATHNQAAGLMGEDKHKIGHLANIFPFATCV